METRMSESLTRPFTKSEMDDMRREAPPRTGPDEGRLKSDFWAKLRRVGRHLPFVEDLLAAYYCAFDSATPVRVKFVLLGALAYFVLPLDGVPDLLPLLGFADDAAVLAAAIAQVAGAIGDSHRAKAREALRDDEA